MAFANFPVNYDDAAYSMVLQRDDKIILAGSTETADNVNQVALARFNLDGSLDATFDADGMLQVSITSSPAQRAVSSVLQPDGKLLVLAGGGTDWNVARFHTGVTPTTGTSTVSVTDNDTPPEYDYGDAPAGYSTLEPQGPEGVLDTSFGTEGKVTTDFGGNYDAIEGLAVSGDGKIYAVGVGGSSNGFAIARYLPNGTLDTSFSDDGKLTIDYAAGTPAIAPLSGGMSLVAFSTASPAGISIARLKNDGSYDASFGTGGGTLLALDGVTAEIGEMLIQPDGKIVVIGCGFFSGNWDGIIARFNPDGTVDAGFGAGGYVRIDFDRTEITDPIDFFTCGVILPDGKILAGGSTSTTAEMSAGNRIYALARYLPNGAPDPTFGTSGQRVFTLTAGSVQRESVSDLILSSDGKLLASCGGGSDTALLRLNADGTIDASFGSSGRVVAPAGSAYRDPQQIALDHSGKIVAVGWGFSVTRFFDNGALDYDFGTDGSATVTFGNSDEGVSALALQPDGKIIAGGYTGVTNQSSDWGMIRLSGLLSSLTPAKHVISEVYLGSCVDSESDGQPSVMANGDDTNGSDDEDGVAFNSALVADNSVSLSVTASAAGLLSAWVDFNGDGDWNDPGEQIFTDRALTAGANALSFQVPLSSAVGQTYARFRFSTDAGISYYGEASDGEVEDYALTVTAPAATIGNFEWLDANANGIQDAGEAGMAGGGVELYRTVDLAIGNADDVLVAHTITDATGHYVLGGLVGGSNYYLVFRTDRLFFHDKKCRRR